MLLYLIASGSNYSEVEMVTGVSRQPQRPQKPLTICIHLWHANLLPGLDVLEVDCKVHYH